MKLGMLSVSALRAASSSACAGSVNAANSMVPPAPLSQWAVCDLAAVLLAGAGLWQLLANSPVRLSVSGASGSSARHSIYRLRTVARIERQCAVDAN